MANYRYPAFEILAGNANDHWVLASLGDGSEFGVGRVFSENNIKMFVVAGVSIFDNENDARELYEARLTAAAKYFQTYGTKNE